jgi:heat shock protein HslJ
VRIVTCIRLLVVAATLAACGESTATPPRAQLEGDDLARSLVDQRFVVESLTVGTESVEGNKREPIELDSQADWWRFNTGCNGVSIRWRLDEGRVRLRGGGLSTMRGCSDEGSLRDATLARLVVSSPDVRYDGATLDVQGDGVRLVARHDGDAPRLVPAPGPPVAQTLAPGVVSTVVPSGGVYQADRIEVEGTSSAPPIPTTITMSLDGIIVISTGCNELRDQTSLQNDGFHGEFFTSTYQPCDDATRAFERLLLDRLEPFVVRSDAPGQLLVSAPTMTLRAVAAP